MPLSMDQLMPLTEAGPLLDRVETRLRYGGQKATANSLLKLQQDAGIELEKEFGIYDPAAGPETAALESAYQPVTLGRLSAILQKAHDFLPQGDLKNDIAALKKTLLPERPHAAPQVTPQPRQLRK